MKRLSTEERRRQIAEAALRIIAEQGLRKFTVAAISEEVGLADGTIFRHFEDKDDIVLEAVKRLEETLVQQEPPPEGDPIEQLSTFLRRRVQLISERPEIFKVLFSDDLAKAGPEEAASRVAGLKRRSMQLVLWKLREAVDQGLVVEGASAEDLLYVVHGTALALVFSGTELGDVTEGSVSPDAVLETVERMIRAR